MKIFQFITICYMASVLMSCVARDQEDTDGHDHHDHHHHHDHDHDHDHHDHDHDHDDHDHNHDDHDHNHDHNHDHAHHDHELGEDEVAFTRAQAKTIGMEVRDVQPNTFHQVIKTSGQLLSTVDNETTIVAPANGLLSYSQKGLTEGAFIQAGNHIATLSAQHLAEGDPQEKVRLRFETAQLAYERAQALLEESLISQKDHEQARLAFETAQVEYRALSGSKTAKGITLSSTKSGYIKNRLVNEGEYVTVGQPILTVAQSNRLRLRAEVSERYYQQLPHIRTAHFRTPYDEQVYRLDEMNGRLLSYGRSTDGQSFLVPINFELNNVGALVSGAFVEVFLLAQPLTNVLTVPVHALLEEQGLYYVYVKTDDTRYRKQEITKGEDDGTEVVVLHGLAPGDRVVTKGAYHLKLASMSSAIPHGHSH